MRLDVARQVAPSLLIAYRIHLKHTVVAHRRRVIGPALMV